MSRHRRAWRITRRAGAWPRWLLIEDVEADDFVIERGGKQLVLYRDELVVLTARRVVVARLDVRDVVEVVERPRIHEERLTRPGERINTGVVPGDALRRSSGPVSRDHGRWWPEDASV